MKRPSSSKPFAGFMRACLALPIGAMLAAAVAPAQSSSGDPFGNPRPTIPSGDMAPRGRSNVCRFFSPPHPPPLGRAITPAGATPRRLNPPAELAAFVNEPFYPPLSTRMFTKALTQKQRSELERYRAAKVALQNELRAELDRLRATDPAARAEELATLSRRQTRKIAELEKAAV